MVIIQTLKRLGLRLGAIVFLYALTLRGLRCLECLHARLTTLEQSIVARIWCEARRRRVGDDALATFVAAIKARLATLPDPEDRAALIHEAQQFESVVGVTPGTMRTLLTDDRAHHGSISAHVH